MRQLRLVGLAEDGASLVLESPTGESYRLPVDDRVRAACRGDLTRLGQIEIEMDNPLRPREIQMRVRAGESAEQVAASSGMPLDRVLRFASAVLQERARVVAQARGTAIRPAAADALGTLVEERLVSRGTDPATLAWDAWRPDEGGWLVRLGWRHGGERDRDYAATWSFDLARRALQPADPAAEQLSAEEFHARTITAVTPLAVAARAADEAVNRPRPPTEPPRSASFGRPPEAPADQPGGRPGPDQPRGRSDADQAREPADVQEPVGEAPVGEVPVRSRFDEIRAGGRRDRRPGGARFGAASEGAPRRGETEPDERPSVEDIRAGGPRAARPQPRVDPQAAPSRVDPQATPPRGDQRPAQQPGDQRVAQARTEQQPDDQRVAQARTEQQPGDRRVAQAGGEQRPAVPRPGPRPGPRLAAPEAEGQPEAEEPRQVAAAGGATIPGMVVDGPEARESDEDRARRATVPSWDDILLGVRRRH